VFANPNCRNNERQPRRADIKRVPIKLRQTPRTI
jgi:hypothetical protein